MEWQEEDDGTSIEVDYAALNHEADISEGLTYNAFMWLRGTDGFPAAERAIREHEWINNLHDSDDDDESGSPEGEGRRSTAVRRGSVNTGAWAARTETHRWRESFY